MAAHTQQEFEQFMSELKETNQHLYFFCDFDKIKQNIEDIKLSLYMLNSLLGAQNLRKAVETIWNRDRSAFQVMNILIAVRESGKFVLNAKDQPVLLDTFFQSVDGVMEFLDETGLAELFGSQQITNLVDYVFGIETGLDSNARKNRSGHIMEKHVKALLGEYGLHAREEVYSSEWPALTAVLGDDEKRFDFVVEAKGTTYLFEVNFYSGGGSKLNEVARAYSDIAPKINSVPGFEFVWITDGIGWRSAKNKLQEAYNIIPGVYNLTNVHDFFIKLR